MERTTWYAILTVAVVMIACIERFAVYRLLVAYSKWLPEKAMRFANIAALGTLVLALAAVAGNAFVSQHP
jgi:hypothetical protein